jgi:hypothetical protein
MMSLLILVPLDPDLSGTLCKVYVLYVRGRWTTVPRAGSDLT